MRYLFRKLFIAAAWIGLAGSFLTQLQANPAFPGNEAIPEDDPCWVEGPNGFMINNCFKAPTQDPDPTPSPSPEPTDDPNNDQNNPNPVNPNPANNQDTGTVEPPVQLGGDSGGCSLIKR